MMTRRSSAPGGLGADCFAARGFNRGATTASEWERSERTCRLEPAANDFTASVPPQAGGAVTSIDGADSAAPAGFGVSRAHFAGSPSVPAGACLAGTCLAGIRAPTG